MRQNIKNNYTKLLDSKLYNGKYYDYMIYKGETFVPSSLYLDDITIANFSNLVLCGTTLYSETLWSGATNGGVEMDDIGLTGVDNGFICFDKTTITNKEFMDLFLNSHYSIEPDDVRLFLNPITGNTQLFEYPMSIEEENNQRYLSLKGGFYQGFFKLDGFDYQVLPDNFNNDLVFHFDIRPRTDYDISINTANYFHPENDGIFFYLGTRAENKFWKYYKRNPDEYGFDETHNESEYCDSIYDGIVDDEYFSDEYLDKEKLINEYDIKDSDGHNIDKSWYYDIDTDNKFIFFNRTDTGFTVDNWVEGAIVRLQGRKKWGNINYYPFVNRTDTGLTVDDLDSFEYDDLKAYADYYGIDLNDDSDDFDVYKDIRNNVFALRVTENGAIGYRYGVLNCDEDNLNRYEVLEEYSKDGIISKDKWNSVNVRFAILNPTNNKCDKRQRKMKIMIYVNGFLVFISKQLNALSFKRLNEIYQKQEGVPYNISIGGGALGLMEVIMPNYYELAQYILPIEKDFCGTFIGDIKNFKIYYGFIDYSTIKNYLS